MGDASALALVGLRGAGKSCVGRLVARTLGWSCVDLDEALEARSGRAISQWFAEQGEAAFRAAEAETLRAVLDEARDEATGCVVATGGGVVTDPVSRGWLREVWVAHLRVAPEVAAARVAADARARPRLAGSTPLEEARRLWAARAAWYREVSNWEVDASRSPAEVAQAVVEGWRRRADGAGGPRRPPAR